MMTDFNEEIYHALCRNDATVREVRRQFPHNGGSPLSLATALEGNTHVQCLSLHFFKFYVEPVEHSAAREEERLRTYIQTSTSLRSVKYSFCCHGPAMGAWIDAVAANTNISMFEFLPISRVKRVDPNLHPMVADALCRLIHTTQSIKDARIRLGDRIGNLSQAIRSNTTLEYTSIRNCSVASIQPVIDALHGHGSIRRIELGLCDSESTEITPLLVMESLSTLLQSSSILTEISLHCFHFNEATTEQFINAIDSNRSIATLFLSTFRFSSAAVQAMLIAYIQRRNGHCIDGCVPLLQANFGDRHSEEDDFNPRPYSARIVMGPHRQGLTITFSHAVFATFWAFLVEATASSTYPRCLLSYLRWRHAHLDMLNAESAARLIPNLTYLRKIEWAIPSAARHLVLDAFRKNGSLHSVEVRDRFWRYEHIWTARDARLIKAWGERNRHLPELLAQCGTKSEHEQSSTGNEDEAATTGTSIPNPSKASLSSTLFAVALQTPRMALHHVFHGITAMGDDVMGVSSQNRTFSKRIHSRDQAVASLAGCSEEQGVPKKRRRTR